MAVKFTDEQRLAIDTLDRSILVSAAAGSGKTAVLVERILSIILEGKANVDEMLVVTFTKAAASEMKLRLSKEIRKRMHENPDDAPRLREQLGRMYRAYISTIDSFALRVIREFFYETDLEPDFGTCDEIQGELMRREAASELFEEGFSDDHFISDEVGFREFLRLYSEERSEEGMKEDLLAAYSSLRTMPDYFDWAYEKAENMLLTRENFADSELGRAIAEDTADMLRHSVEAGIRIRTLLEEARLEDLYEEKLANEINTFFDAWKASEEGGLDEDLMEKLSGIEFPVLKAKKAQAEAYAPVKDEVKALRDTYKEALKSWRSRYLDPDIETRFAEMNAAYKYTVYYIRLLEEFEKLYSAKKAERRVMDFADMEHNAVRILSSESAADTLRRRFRFVFVDEYQDTNKIQEHLISRVSRQDNVFKVGDVKQSIYKFRQAEPEIFESLYKTYSDPECTAGIAIDLSKNFRSNDATVRYINRVFTEIMDGYDERARLNTGCEGREGYDLIPEVHVLTEQEDDPPEDGSQASEGGSLDVEIVDLSKEEAEAAYIADQAYKLIGTEFFDAKQRIVRKAEARDIVILLRAVKGRGEIMARALRNKGIESHIEDSDNYFDTVEISVAISLLTCIDNMKRDIPLISALHSEVFGWKPDELARVRIEHNSRPRDFSGVRPAYWEALQWYEDHGSDERLRAKASYAADKIREWRRLSRMMTLEDFVWKVLTDSGYYRMAGAMNGGPRRQANLRTLADRAGKYRSETVSSLSSYISFLDLMRKKNISNGQASLAGSDDDVVRITTIHKSKGLEYPFVIVGGLGHKFRYDNSQKKFSFDSDIGVSMPYIDPERRFWRSTLIQRAIAARSRRSSYKEELRVLYVAMTRARNKLIMVGTCGSLEKLAEYTPDPGNYLKAIRNVIRTADNLFFTSPLELRESDRRTYRAKSFEERIPENLTAEERDLYDEINRRFTYTYPDSDLLTAKAKYSVSAIRKKELAEEESESEIVTSDHEVVTLWTVSEARKKASAADIGIAYHRIMEFLDFAKVIQEDGSVDTEYIRERAELLRDSGAIEEDVFRELDMDKAASFFRCDLGRRAAAAARAGTLRKEKPFTLRTTRGGNEMLVQGVIDCCFEENGEIVLVDYKSSFIKPGREHQAELERISHEYKVQIELYSEAAFKGTGKQVSEAYLYLFETGEALRM